MKKKITDNFGIKLLSLLIAFVIWIMIVNVIDPIKTKTIKDIPVTVINTDVIENLGQCYEITSDKVVTVTVKGKKSDVDKLKTSDFEAVADMEQISVTSAVPVKVSLTKKVDNETDIIVGESNTIIVRLDNEITNSYEVNLNLTGTVTNDYYISKEEVRLGTSKIKVSGPQQVIDTIDKVQVDVDISDFTETSKGKYEVKAYDVNGKQITSKRMEFSKDYIEVTVNPLVSKSIAIKTQIIGDANSDYFYKGMSYDTKSIIVAGNSDTINSLGNINIEIDISGATESVSSNYDLSEYLPDDVKIVSDVTSVEITAVIDELTARRIQFKASELKFVNLPNDVITNYDVDKILVVNIKGEEKVINEIEIDALNPHVDMSGLAMGTQNVQVMFDEVEGVTIVNNPTMVVQLVDKASIVGENTQTGTDTGTEQGEETVQ